jgi:hypothetical protein
MGGRSSATLGSLQRSALISRPFSPYEVNEHRSIVTGLTACDPTAGGG